MSGAPNKRTLPWGWALGLGLLTALAICLCSPLWALGQMAGPTPFVYLLFFLFGPVLLLSVFVVKARTITAALVCGLLLSLPVACSCWLIPKALPGIDYFNEMSGDSVAVIVIALLVTVLATFQRQLEPDSAESDDTTNCGSPDQLGSPGDNNGPPSAS